MEFGQSEKIDEMLAKYLGDKLKVKAPKDPNKPKRSKSGLVFCDEHRPALLQKAKKGGKKVNIGEISKALVSHGVSLRIRVSMKSLLLR